MRNVIPILVPLLLVTHSYAAELMLGAPAETVVARNAGVFQMHALCRAEQWQLSGGGSFQAPTARVCAASDLMRGVLHSAGDYVGEVPVGSDQWWVVDDLSDNLVANCGFGFGAGDVAAVLDGSGVLVLADCTEARRVACCWDFSTRTDLIPQPIETPP